MNFTLNLSIFLFSLFMFDERLFSLTNYQIIKSVKIDRLAYRPKDMSLDNSKFSKIFKQSSPTIKETIRLLKSDYEIK